MRLFPWREAPEIWNRFVADNYPPVGAFMHSFEWGMFQENMGRKMERYFIADAKNAKRKLAVFTLVYYPLPFGFCYAYIPRGPVMRKDSLKEATLSLVLTTLSKWVEEKIPRLLFLRIEPPIKKLPFYEAKKLYTPRHSIQPRHNLVLSLTEPEEDILGSFHSSTRSNISRAEKRGVHVELKDTLTKEELLTFYSMIEDTVKRNGGVRAYPNHDYFQKLFASLPPLEKESSPYKLSVGFFCGYQHGEPAAIHVVVFFGTTATYLFGASYSERLSSKVTTYLHWAAAKEAKRRGFQFYDLGGIDKDRWPSITAFKRQFKGKEYSYVGTVDLSFYPLLHQTHEKLRLWKRKMNQTFHGK